MLFFFSYLIYVLCLILETCVQMSLLVLWAAKGPGDFFLLLCNEQPKMGRNLWIVLKDTHGIKYRASDIYGFLKVTQVSSRFNESKVSNCTNRIAQCVLQMFTLSPVHKKFPALYRLSENLEPIEILIIFIYRLKLKVKRLNMAWTLDERVEEVLRDSWRHRCMLLKFEISVTLGRELQSVVLLSISICWAKSAKTW
jgi:hypothetical protein